MFDLKELPRFRPLASGKERFSFPGKTNRRVRLEVLSEGPSRLYVTTDDGRFFIGHFEGYDVVQFAVPGVWKIEAQGAGNVKIYCGEMEKLNVEASDDAVSFAQIMTRRVRNPELERLMHKMNINLERRLQQVENDVTLRIAAERRLEDALKREAAEAARREQDAEQDEGDDDGDEAEAEA